MKKTFANNKVIKNSWWDMLQQAYVLLLSFIVGLVAARYLGPSNYGIIGLVGSVCAFFSSISWLGINSVFINELINNKNKNGEYIATAILLKFFTSICALVAAFIFVKIVYNNSLIETVLIIHGSAILFQFSDIFQFWFQSRQEFRYTSACIIVTKTIVVVYQVCLIVQKKDVIWFSSVNLLYSFLLCVLMSSVFFSKFDLKLKIDLKLFMQVLKKSRHYIISSLAVTIYLEFDRIMIAKMLTNREVGIYNAAMNISTIWQFIPLAIINSTRPVLIEKKRKSEEDFFETYRKLICVVSMVAICFCVVITIFASQIIRILYGVEYLNAIAPLRVCTWATAISMFGVIRSIWMISFDHYKYDKYFKVVAASVNIFLNLYAIQKWGILGAAITTIISYFVETFLLNYCFKATRRYNRIILESWRDWKKLYKNV